MRQPVDIDEALAIKLQKIAREDGNADLERGETRTNRKQPRLAHALQPITKGYYGPVMLARIGQEVEAYARDGDVDTGQPFIAFWTTGDEISRAKGEDPPQAGQWDIFSLDVNYFGLPPASQGCGCGDALDGTANHDCTPECGCINKTRYMYPPALWVRWPDAVEKILWSIASVLVTLKYAGECLWVSNWFAGPDYIPPEEEWEGEEAPEPVHDEYRWEVDRRALTIKLRRRSVEYPNAPELYLEYCLTPACGLRCNGVWKGTFRDNKNIETPAVCEICVTPTLRLSFFTCWACPQDPPEAYEMTVPETAFYHYTPSGGSYTEKLIGVAGKKITLRRVGACDNWVVPVDDPPFWTSEAGECPYMKGDPVVGGFANPIRFPRGGNCNCYYFEDTTTTVWLFVEASPQGVFAAATFLDKDLCTYDPPFCEEGKDDRLFRYYVLHEGEGGTPSYEGQESENWCQEPTLELRSDWFDTVRTLTNQTKYWYPTIADMEAQNGYSLVAGDLDNELFAVIDIGFPADGTGFFLPSESVVPGETAWSYMGNGNPLYDPGINKAEQAGIVQIKGITLPKVTNSGAPGATCSGEETEAGTCPETASCRWEEAFTSNELVPCIDGEVNEVALAAIVADLEATLPAAASTDYEVLVAECAGGQASVRLRYLYLVTPCPDGCEPCEDPGDITGLTYKESSCNQAA